MRVRFAPRIDAGAAGRDVERRAAELSERVMAIAESPGVRLRPALAAALFDATLAVVVYVEAQRDEGPRTTKPLAMAAQELPSLRAALARTARLGLLDSAEEARLDGLVDELRHSILAWRFSLVAAA